MAVESFDFVVYGATGYTGQFVLREVARKAQVDTNLTWAVAGRSRVKLLACLKSAEQELDIDLSQVEVIIAESNDYSSLSNMAAKAKVVLNCVGPYRFHGEPVVRACVENGTNHVDISGEPAYLERMELLYTQNAREKECYVIGACGLDCVPNDMGLVYARQKFDGQLVAIDSFLAVNSGDGGAGINIGTWNTLVHSLGNWGSLSSLRKQMPKVKLPKPVYRQPKKFVKKFRDEYYVPFMGADKSVVFRSQRDEFVASQSPPINDNLYVKVGNAFSLVKAIIFGFLFILMSLTSYGRALLLKYPKVFSFGLVYPDGPPKELIYKQSMELVLECHGYSSSGSQGQPDKSMTVTVSGPDPGYIGTSTMMVESAYTILREKSKLPDSGGVMTTGYAFKDTSLIERLGQRGVKFEITSRK